MALRDEIALDADAMKIATEAFKMLQSLTPDQWQLLMDALQKGDQNAAAALFGLTPQEAEHLFSALKHKATEIVKAHPELVDPTKGFAK
jgi:hypothetical protein